MTEKYLTSKNNRHRHIWKINSKRTSINRKHSHKINLNMMIAEKGNTDHEHKLLRKEIK